MISVITYQLGEKELKELGSGLERLQTRLGFDLNFSISPLSKDSEHPVVDADGRFNYICLTDFVMHLRYLTKDDFILVVNQKITSQFPDESHVRQRGGEYYGFAGVYPEPYSVVSLHPVCLLDNDSHRNTYIDYSLGHEFGHMKGLSHRARDDSVMCPLVEADPVFLEDKCVDFDPLQLFYIRSAGKGF